MKKIYTTTRLMMLLTILSSASPMCSASDYTIQPQEAGEMARHVEQLKHEIKILNDENQALRRQLAVPITSVIGLENRLENKIKKLQEENETLKIVIDKMTTELNKQLTR